MSAPALPDLSGRTVLVTGANSGIGKATAELLAAGGADVVMTARKRSRGELAAAEIRRGNPAAKLEVGDLDLARLQSVRELAEWFLATHARLDVLVLNAGMTSARRRVTEDGHEMLFQVNHLGHFLLTNLLLDRLVASAPSRVVVVASVAHAGAELDFDDLQSERSYRGMQAYARSKLANVLFARELARRTDGTGVIVNALHPGTVRSGWGDEGEAGFWLTLGLRLARPFFLSPQRAAERVAHLAVMPDAEGSTGGYYVRRRLVDPAPEARDDEVARRLWEISAELVGLTD